MTNVFVIIQARHGSSRLPGKILKPLGWQVGLALVLERCKQIQGIDGVCCAVPESSENDEVAQVAEECNAIVYRGSEDDVLDRYYQAAKMLQADTIIRVTSDCPLIDPEVVGRVLDLFKTGEYHFTCNNYPPSWPHGLDCEVTSFEWLEKAAREATTKDEREHVMPFIRFHEDGNIGNVACPSSNVSDCRWTLDNQDDFEQLSKIFEGLEGIGKFNASWTDVLEFIIGDPSLDRRVPRT